MRNRSGKGITMLFFCLALAGALTGACFVAAIYGGPEKAEIRSKSVQAAGTEASRAASSEASQASGKSEEEAGKASGEPESGAQSPVQKDPYEELEKTLDKGGQYEGFLLSLKQGAPKAKVKEIDRAIRKGAPLRKLKYSGNTYTASSVEDIRAVVKEDLIDTISPDYLRTMDEAGEDPDDAYFERQYNLTDMNVPSVWEDALEGQDLDASVDMDRNGVGDDDDIVVAVIDSGLDPGHEDIDEDRVIKGKSFADGTQASDTRDADGHGTMVAGIIGARKNNQAGVAGILQRVKVMPLRVFGDDNTTSDSTVIEAINYATEQRKAFDRGNGGANIAVINLSLSGEDTTPEEKAACSGALEAGIIVVSSAGNGYSTGQYPSYPAQWTMGVGSVGKNGKLSSFSQRFSEADGEGYANKVWVCSPGAGIWGPFSIMDGQNTYRDYTSKNGTSFSCPEVAALAALCKGMDNRLDQAGFKELLKETAEPADSGEGKIDGQDKGYGWGKVDFARTIGKIIRDRYADPSKQAKLEVRVWNAAGSVMEEAAVSVYPLDDSGSAGDAIPAGQDGSWQLQQGGSYRYRVAAAGYDVKQGDFTILAEQKTMCVTVSSSKKYDVRLNLVDETGQKAEGYSNIIVYDRTRNLKAYSGKNTEFRLPIGKYEYEVVSEDYLIEGSTTFNIDPVAEDLSGGKEITIVLSRPQLTLCWGEEEQEQVQLSLVAMLDYQISRQYTMVTDDAGGTLPCEVNGVTLGTVLKQNCPEYGVTKSVGEVKVRGTLEGEPTDITLDGSRMGKLMIALAVDPATGNLIEEGNHMRLAVDGGRREEWLYCPEEIRITLVDKEDPAPAPTPSVDPAKKKVTEVRDLPSVKRKSVKGRKKSFTVKWKKLSKKNRGKVAGIEIQYSTSWDFPAGATWTTTASKTKTSKKIKRPSGGKALYVRIRTYKKVGGVKHISAWTKFKKVKKLR